MFSGISADEVHQKILEPLGNVTLSWSIDWDFSTVSFAIKNGLSKKYAWIAIGFSRRGKFPRTDFCFFQIINGTIARIVR